MVGGQRQTFAARRLVRSAGTSPWFSDGSFTATLDAQPMCCRDSFRVARVYTAPRRKSSQRAEAGRAFGPRTSSSAQRTHGPDHSRDARILMAARPWTPTSIWLAEDGTPPPFGKRERCSVALTAPIDIQTPSLITDDVHGS